MQREPKERAQRIDFGGDKLRSSGLMIETYSYVYELSIVIRDDACL
jgi:hypothetical protein